jgi:hypothetical protein
MDIVPLPRFFLAFRIRLLAPEVSLVGMLISVTYFHSILGEKVAHKKSSSPEWFLLPRLYPKNKKKKNLFYCVLIFLKN